MLKPALTSPERPKPALPATYDLNPVDLRSMPANRVHFVDHREAHGEALFVRSQSWPSKGTVAKQSNSVYTAGRRPEWMKMKNPNYLWREALRFGDD